MRFRPYTDGVDRATVRVDFLVTIHNLVLAAKGIVANDNVRPVDEVIDGLTKTAITDELRKDLWLQGDTYLEYGHEQFVHPERAIQHADAIEAKVRELFGQHD